MSEFNGCKFRPTGNTRTYIDRDGQTKTRDEFVPTSSYLKYLDEKKAEACRQELKLLKTKLDNQFRDYGYVDDIDFSEYQYKVKAYAKYF